jgi:lysophospholipase L1-like esterase
LPIVTARQRSEYPQRAGREVVIMKVTGFIRLTAWRTALIGAALGLGACDAANDILNRNDGDNVYYHLSLGTSLSVGVQPDSNGLLLPTSDGYADQLYDSIRPAFEAAGAGDRELELTKLGCPGETLDDMINGGSCPYIAGSQLDAAVDFLNDNSGRVYLVTIDIGGNDFRNAGCIGATVDIDCVNAVTDEIAADLATVLAALNDAAGPGTTIIGMNYYNPYLSSWLEGNAGETLAMLSIQAATILNDALSTTYNTAGVTMADTYLAFDSEEFNITVPTPLPSPNDQLPMAVANICAFTYICDTSVGPDIHANTAGYSLIADTLAAALP